MWAGEGQRERERERDRIWRGSRLWPVSTEPDAGLELTDCEITTWAKVGCLTNRATQAPHKMIIYFWERERETEYEQGRGREREGDTETEASSRLWAVSTEPDAGLKLTNCEITTWAKVGCLTDWANQAPQETLKYGEQTEGYWRGCGRGDGLIG